MTDLTEKERVEFQQDIKEINEIAEILTDEMNRLHIRWGMSGILEHVIEYIKEQMGE